MTTSVMVMVCNPAYGPGRQTKRWCKRGHAKVPRQRCEECHKITQKIRYALDPAYRQRKRDYQNKYRREFREQFGFWPSHLQTRKFQRSV